MLELCELKLAIYLDWINKGDAATPISYMQLSAGILQVASSSHTKINWSGTNKMAFKMTFEKKRGWPPGAKQKQL